MKKLLLAVVALASVATPLQSVFAQADLFDKMARAKQVEKQNSMNSSELKNRGFNGTFEKDLSDTATDPNKNCVGDCPNSEQIPMLPPGTKKRTVTTSGPMRTHHEAVSSMAYVNQDFSYLSMPWIIKEITMAYLDMGVFGGQNSGYQKASGAVQIRGDSEERLFHQAALNPEIRDVTVSGYIGCVAKAQEEGFSYTQATNECLEDGQMTAAAFSASGQGNSNWLETHPEFQQPDIVGPPAPGDTIMLTDLLLLGASGTDADMYRQSFKRIFGDMRIYSQSLVRGAPKSFSYTMEPPQLPPAAHDKELHRFVWEKLHELMRGYCEYWKAHMDVDPTTHKPFDFSMGMIWGHPFFIPVKTSFWGNRDSGGGPKPYPNNSFGPDASTFIDLTTTNFEFSPQVGDIFFGLFYKTQDVKGVNSRQGDLKCDELKSIATNDPSNYYKLSGESGKHALEWRVIYDRAVNLIARGKRYEIYQAGKNWVDSRTDGSQNSDAREKAYTLIRAVISDDPQRNEDTLEEQSLLFKQELARLQQSQVGVLGHSLTGVYADGPSSNLSGGAGKGS